ncbi:tRNA lysidine(34) synthetase TilS [Pseudosulfitobacter pseudonitzschiae]|nr:tRNA lysidine(34) synthetase TilS [Pseudosulfitobacter pseudonitzschiae]MBM1815155.1 tRNA lysidine(34) synthetase TilS [Pseudosulfitobacter pseudonitzschiae]MBM1832146.1 tRNA lysidine(34) synthetase TilS [Pseudosulfitobacter pseudonitzschiae]MBM1837014.1 tRNA lysidine(34) synthetase TilS [Pseudosulfitobacter pseudonitzschiae]MBM1841860.1 tRNA lysidine(34) synthetase TilS [Pseudosulfitobacter pseudonitzschiae]MBM1846728.1 tRNA lysidine(34) synthetase TilS [Pseudosulfitobacter pseudonitzschia
MDDDAALNAAIAAHLLPEPPEKLGVAVSGGGDSMALLALAAGFAQTHEVQVHVISVDHGLRSGARDELALVAAFCAERGLSHHIESWSGWDGSGNLQGAARAARYKLINRWAETVGLRLVLLGHTVDDQAETLMMRLARGAGVDGLSAMAPRRMREGITYVRPFLDITRAELRDYLTRHDIAWADDPSNDDTSFARVAMRQALTQLEPLGLSARTLAGVARNMRQSREALNWQTHSAAHEVAQVQAGAVRVDVQKFRALPEEISRRLLVQAVMWINGGNYPPRRSGVAGVQAAVREGRTTTLDGCQISFAGEAMWIYRELNAVRDTFSKPGGVWDNRWRVEGPENNPRLHVGPLGEDGLALCPDWREHGLPRGAMLSLPAVWEGGDLVVAPVFDDAAGWSAEIAGGQETFFAALLSRQ